jgi:PII-like signaling protein
MKLHLRKKLEIAIASAYVARVGELLNRHGVTGFTVLQAVMGRGSSGDWVEDSLSGADQHVVIMAIMKPETADALLADLQILFETYRGIATVADVQVMRAERF